MKLILTMSHFFVLLIQVPYVILSLICGISIIISNWNEYVETRNKKVKTAYMLLEASEAELENETEIVPIAA